VPLDGVFPLAPTFDHAGPMARTVADCVRMMEALVPGFDVGATRDVAIGLAWAEHCEPLVRARVEEAGAAAGARAIDFPLPDEVGPAFMREVADVHRDLFAEHEEAYGTNVRTKIERCLAVTDAEYERAARLRSEYRERAEEALAGVDLLLVPTLGFVPPPADVDELAARASLIRFTFPFNVLGWPALALPVGTADDDLPASVQLVGRPGDDAGVLAAGTELEASLVRGKH
jgi:Asp-tRNA(Asn)/Glu-tRNA(Gln) amidotransferase A subunit family amidase